MAAEWGDCQGMPSASDIEQLKEDQLLTQGAIAELYELVLQLQDTTP